jgi:hypothetical protein
VLGSKKKVFAMEDETPRDELVRLIKAQRKARQDEVYGGMSNAEKAESYSRAERIRELEKREAQIGDLRKRSA